MTQDDRWLTPSAWGTERGMSRQAAHKAVKRLGIELRDGKLHAGRATAIYTAMTRPRVKAREPAAAAAGPVAAESMSYHEARRRQAVADATTAEINLAILRKRAMWTDDATRMWQHLALIVTPALLNFPARVGPLVAAETSPMAVQLLLQKEVHQILTDLADGVAAAEATVGETQDADA